MHSLFGRSGSTPKRSKSGKTPPVSGPTPPAGRAATTDGPRGQGTTQGYGFGVSEFGTVPNGQSRTMPTRPTQPLTPPHSPDGATPPLLPPKYVFVPTRIVSHTLPDNSVDSFVYDQDEVTGQRQYGFLGGVGSKATLGLGEVKYIIDVVGKELDRRGLTTPLVFSNQALELNQTRTKMLIQAYLDTITQSSRARLDAFLQDVRFAKEHELAWLLRWSLSRITRIKEGYREVCHGVLEWEAYEEWRGRERAASYPTDAFPFLAVILPSEVYEQIVIPLFHLLSRFAAHSHLSGLTPHTLSSLFAPLLFDIPTSASAMVAHATFVRAASATEHLLLAYIRSTGMKGSLGVSDLPFRLKEWVSGYPAMVASDADLARGGPRKGARVVRCERATRTVRAYSKDLVVQAELWANDLPPQEKWDAWERVTWKARRGEISRPKFAPSYRRRMMVKENLPLPSSTGAGLSRHTSYGTALKPGTKAERKTVAAEENEEGRWSSLAGKEWSLFEEGGFDAPLSRPVSNADADMKSRLQFDLTESAKHSIGECRRTMDWSEFASPSGGFNRTDPLLDVSLTFSAPIESSITDWPKERDELRRRLHKSQKDTVPFTYDTTPRFGADATPDPVARTDDRGRVYVEEAFVECWADLMIGANWVEREELTFRETNWALIEYKAKPSRPDPRAQDADPLGDPRRTELYFLFEERVPMDYQQALAAPVTKKQGFTLFSPKNKKRTPVISPSESTRRRLGQGVGVDDGDFDRMLLHRNHPKKVSLTKSASDQPHSSIWHMSQESPVASPTAKTRQVHRTRSGGHMRRGSKGEAAVPDDPKLTETKGIFFGSKKSKGLGMRRVKTDEKQKEQEMDFDLQSASGISSSEPSPKDGSAAVKGKNNEKWMDILISNGARRMDRQDATMPQPKGGRVNLGLPVSPHPPARQLSPAPGEGAVAVPAPQLTPPQDYAEEMTTPCAVPPERQRSIRRKAVPVSDDDDVEGGFEPVSPTSQDTFPDDTEGGGRYSSDVPELLHPSPRKEREYVARDTIHGIVDQYQRDSTVPEEGDFEPVHEDEEELAETRARARARTGDGDYFDQEHRGRASEDSRYGDSADHHADVDGEGEGEELEPPEKGMIFDLTPGREPSPLRYKHGEPLHFVGEEPEEEEDGAPPVPPKGYRTAGAS